MQQSEMIITLLATTLVSFIYLLCYENLSDKKEILKVNLYTVLISIICGVLCSINTYYNNYSFLIFTNIAVNRAITGFILLLVTNYIVFREKIRLTFIKVSFCYILLAVVELVLSVVVALLDYTSIVDIGMNVSLKSKFSIIVILIIYFITKQKFAKNVVNKIYRASQSVIIPIILLISCIIWLFVLSHKYIVDMSLNRYYSNLVLIFCLIVLVSIAVYNNYKVKKEEEKTEVLLDFMKKYEKKVDLDRINRHEMLNNLLILKSFKNKNTKKYCDTLDDFISLYSGGKLSFLKNVYNLPSGLKGIIYYRMYDMNEIGINVVINISNDSIKSLDRIKGKDYTRICKIIGILLNNAKEATSDISNKSVSIDIYKDRTKNIIICIDNTFEGKIKLSKLGQKNYSSKGKTRGIGLYLVNRMINSSKILTLNREIINNVFSTKLTIITNKKTS